MHCLTSTFSSSPCSKEQAAPGAQEFVSNHPQIQAALRQLPEQGLLDQSFSVLLVGPKGAGHTSFARHAWRRMQQVQRPFVVAHCRHLRGTRDIHRLMAQAYRGDLHLEGMEQLSTRLLNELRRYLKTEPYVRLIGSFTSASSAVLARELRALFPQIVGLLPLNERREDIPLISLQILQSYGVTASREVCELLARSDWPSEVSQLVHCIRKSASAARAQGLRELSLEAVYLYLREGAQFYSHSQMLGALDVANLLEVSKRWGVKDMLRMIEAAVIAAALQETYGCASHAASILQVPINTLGSRKKVLSEHIRSFSTLLDGEKGFAVVYHAESQEA